MRPFLRRTKTLTAALAALALLSACSEQEKAAATQDAPLSQVRISSKSGEILILEPDGSVSTMALDSAGGRDAFAVTEADLAALSANLDLQLPAGVVSPRRQRGPTAQERALAAFAARTKPALPAWREGTELAPEDFISVRVTPLRRGSGNAGASELVEVSASLRRGVDADIAFSYATCALAGWAKENGGKYGRHIRTLQDTRSGRLMIGAAFTVSDSKPLGLRVMETNETLQECKARGIPAA